MGRNNMDETNYEELVKKQLDEIIKKIDEIIAIMKG